jgi:DNA-directed RNA polymerase specialized sigma24 family protein
MQRLAKPSARERREGSNPSPSASLLSQQGRHVEVVPLALCAARREVLRDLRSLYGDAYSAIHEDAAQHAIEVVLRRGPDAFDERGIDGYCIAVARHYVGHEHRRHGRRRTDLADDAEGSRAAGAFDIDDAIELRDLRAGIDALNPNQRLALTGRLLGLSYKQIQAATGCSYTWVNKHTAKGRTALRAAA